MSEKVILIVDDEDEIREFMVEDLQDEGFKTFEACNGRDAFNIVKKEHIDLVVTDVRRPNGDGVELLKNVMAIEGRRPPVIVVSGFSDVSEKDVIKMGAKAFVHKPYDIDEFMELIVKTANGEAPAEVKKSS
jgi:DNA-binding response OmpR family regulator